jgi:hypothetical protein
MSTPNLLDEEAAADHEAVTANHEEAAPDNYVAAAKNEGAASDNPDDTLDGQTGPFRAFLEIMAQREAISHTEIGGGGCIYKLENGSLSVADAGGAELWRSDSAWWVDSFKLGDVDGDGVEDFGFSLWKSYRFGAAHPSRMKNDDETVRNHLFVYTILSGQVMAVWGSSDLPCPIYSFELDPSGKVTPVSSGMLLITYEGEYREDYAQTAAVKRVYSWGKWGFIPLE